MTCALALALPDVSEHFYLLFMKQKTLQKGVSTQILESQKCYVAYLSQPLDSVAIGGPHL